VLLASGLIQGHGSRFWAVSALIGAGYGAVFSLTPIIVSVVWGVENFATNWGIVAMVPAGGAALWGGVYSAVYEAGARRSPVVGIPEDENHSLCFGSQCYAPTFWAMAASVWVACGLWIFAWRGPGGWSRRGIAVLICFVHLAFWILAESSDGFAARGKRPIICLSLIAYC
jgi:hypothetical protein